MKIIFHEEKLRLQPNLTLAEVEELKKIFNVEVKKFYNDKDEFVYILPKGMSLVEGVYEVNNVIWSDYEN